MLITLDQLKTSLQAMKNFVIQHIPTKVSDLTNDSNFTTKSYVDGEIDSLQTTISTKADIDGSYDSMAVKESERLASLDFTEDNTPYLFRKSGGDGNEEPVIVGGSVVWNQLADIIGETETKNGITFTNAGDGSYIVNGTNTGTIAQKRVAKRVSLEMNHIYYIHGCPSGGSSTTYQLSVWFNNEVSGISQKDRGSGFFYKHTTEYTNNNASLFIDVMASATVNNVKFIPQISDLTAMFGTAIAAYVLSLGNTAELAYLRKYGFFTKDYYPFCEPTFKHVEGLVEHKMVGFNQWDEDAEVGSIDLQTGQNTTSSAAIRSKNYIPVIPSQSYYVKKSGLNMGFRKYGANKEYLGYISANSSEAATDFGSDVHFIRFVTNSVTTYNPNNTPICVNLSDPAKNGTYEPYKSYTYPLDTDVVLRGIPKLDSNNNLYFDGDVYKADGTVTRRYVVADIGTWNWQYVTNDGDPYFVANPIDKKSGLNILCSAYPTTSNTGTSSLANKQVGASGTGTGVFIRDDTYSDVETFKTAMSGVYLVYEKAAPTTETADPYAPLQLADPYGTEEWVLDDEAFPMPVGQETKYRNIVTMQDVKDIQSNIDDIQFDLNNKQDILTFDSTPTANSLNPVTSGGIKTALNNTYLLTTGVEIPENSDLNNYTDVGTYYSGATTPLSIDNHPNTTYPFKLFVEDIHTDITQSYNIKSIRQMIVYDCSPVLVYQRQGTIVDNQKTFGNWQLDSITKVSDLNNDSGFITGMTILSYGSSTWNDFITAYNANKVVYCRASSNSNPASGSQTRLAFMAYVNNATSPSSVEFQYYRSVSSHSASQQGDQVYVYTLTSAGAWSVTVREAMSKIAVGTNMSSSYSNGTLTLNSKGTVVTNVSGATPVITAVKDTMYVCGEVTSLQFTPCESGICDVRFTSGSTVTVLTIPSTVKFPNSFDPTSLETNTIYEINILDGVYGVVTSWAI